MKWHVEVAGEDGILGDLASQPEAGDLHVEKAGDGWILSASLFRNLRHANEVRTHIDEILFGLNAYARTFLGARSDIYCIDLRSTDEDGIRTVHVRVVDGLSVSASLVGMSIEEIDGTIHHGVFSRAPVRKLPTWMDLIRTNANVRKVERLLALQPHDWANLTRVLEVIEGDVGGQHELIKQGYTSKEERNLFGRTANNPGAVGDLARHGYSNAVPPQDPMTLEGARGYVASIKRKWIESKLGL